MGGMQVSCGRKREPRACEREAAAAGGLTAAAAAAPGRARRIGIDFKIKKIFLDN